MREGVVHLLEMVHIDQYDGVLVDGAVEQPVHRAPVGQAGQRVLEALLQQVLGAPAELQVGPVEVFGAGPLVPGLRFRLGGLQPDGGDAGIALRRLGGDLPEQLVIALVVGERGPQVTAALVRVGEMLAEQDGGVGTLGQRQRLGEAGDRLGVVPQRHADGAAGVEQVGDRVWAVPRPVDPPGLQQAQRLRRLADQRQALGQVGQRGDLVAPVSQPARDHHGLAGVAGRGAEEDERLGLVAGVPPRRGHPEVDAGQRVEQGAVGDLVAEQARGLRGTLAEGEGQVELLQAEVDDAGGGQGRHPRTQVGAGQLQRGDALGERVGGFADGEQHARDARANPGLAGDVVELAPEVDGPQRGLDGQRVFVAQVAAARQDGQRASQGVPVAGGSGQRLRPARQSLGRAVLRTLDERLRLGDHLCRR